MDNLTDTTTNDKVDADLQVTKKEPENLSKIQETIKKLDEFFSCFFDDDETIHLRFIKAKGETQNLPVKNATLTRRNLREDSESIIQLLRLNKRYGVYFTVNAGGTKKNEINRYTAVFCEDDERTIEEQLKRYKLFKSSILIKTKRSVHTYWLLKNAASLED